MTDEAPLILRQARREEADIIGELAAQAYITGGHLSATNSYAAVLRDVEPRLDQTLVLAQPDSGTVVAAIAALPHGHPMAEACEEGEWEFRYLAVHPERWGNGDGRRLVAAVEELAREAGARRLVLRVIDTNPRAQRLYEHLGYEHLPERDVTFPTREDPTTSRTLLLYAKDLADAG